jgi:hypothetical protein
MILARPVRLAAERSNPTTNVPGPWSDVSGVTSPFLAETANAAHFFRVKQ